MTMNSIEMNFFEPNGHSGESEFALRIATKAFAWLKEHYETEHAAYPLRLINLVAVPSNDKWRIFDGLGIGLIDHDLLLIDDAISSPQRRIEAALNVALVVARQWFGHLVVPKSVKDSWITEGLAMHTALRIVDHIEPQLKASNMPPIATIRALE